MAVCLKHVAMDWFRDESEAGDGYENISAVYPTPERSRDRERVRRGISLGHVKAKRQVKKTTDADNGPIWINVEQAEKWLNSDQYADRPQRAANSVQASQGVAKAERASGVDEVVQSLDTSFRRVATAMERIAEAMELIATQPRHDRHTPFGDLLHASTNGDR